MLKSLNFLLLLLSITLIFLSISQAAANNAILKNISSICQDKPIILVGENHQQPDSQKLFLDLVQYYTRQGNAIFIGLEIPADKQTELDVALSGGFNFSFIYPTINHPAYRDMLHSLGAMKGNITVKAIDARDDEKSRDIAMSSNLMLALSSGVYDMILVLVGNNHVIKEIKWHEDVKSGKKYLAGYLIDAGVNPCSIQQMFKKTGGKPILESTNTARGALLAMEVINSVNHSDDMKGNDVCDAVIKWGH